MLISSHPPDLPRKVARLTTSDTSLSSIPEEPLSPHTGGNGLNSTTQTPVRHMNTDVRNIFSGNSTEEGTTVHTSRHVEVELGTVDKVGGGDNGSQDDFQSRPYTPPSPYTLSPSPSSPQSPTLNIDQSSTSKRRKLDGRSRTEDETIRPTSSQATPTRNQFKSPSKAIASQSVPHIPGSASRYKRSLDFSQLEHKEPCQLPNPLMQCFEAAYQSLTSNELSASHAQDSEEGFDALFNDPDSDELHPNLDNKDILTQESLIATPRRQPHPHVLTRAPSGPHISVTGSDGSRVYLKLRGGAKYGGRGEVCVCACIKYCHYSSTTLLSPVNEPQYN